MILEALITTINDDQTPNISPMGATIRDSELNSFELRPFNTSTTFANLKRTKMGVLHVTDDVELFAQAAIGKLAIGKLDLSPFNDFIDAKQVTGKIIRNACRCYEFTVEFIDETGPRTSLNCRTVHRERFRDFWGFNRAKHAVIEAAILATRLDFLPAPEISEQYSRLETIVIKTGGESEKRAFELLSGFVGHQNGIA